MAVQENNNSTLSGKQNIKAKKWAGDIERKKLSQEKIYSILSKGAILTMEDDLKEAGRMQKIKAKLIPVKLKESKPLPALRSPLPKQEQIVPVQKIEPKKPKLKKIILPKREVKKQSKGDYRKEILDILQKLKTFPSKKRPLEEKRALVDQELVKEEADLRELISKEDQLEQEREVIEKQEQATEAFEKKHELEKSRWVLDEKIRVVEEERWAQEEEVEKLEIAKGNVENQLKQIGKEQDDLEKRKKACDDILEMARLRQEKESLKKHQEPLDTGKSRDKLLEEKQTLSSQLVLIKKEEEKIESSIKDIEGKEAASKNPNERKKWGQERWQAEERRKIQEKKRWNSQKELVILETNLKQAEKQHQSKLSQKQILEEKMTQIESRLGDMKPVDSIVLKTEQDEKQETEVKAKAKEQERILVNQRVKQKAVVQKQAIDEQDEKERQEQQRKEKLAEIEKRARIEKLRTKPDKLTGPMVKAEILKKITKISPKEEAERREFLSRVAGKKKTISEPKKNGLNKGLAFHPMIRKTSLFEKILMRLFLSILIIGLIAAVVYFVIKPILEKPVEIIPETEETEATSTEEIIATSTEATSTEETITTSTEEVVEPPTSLINSPEVELFNFTDKVEIPFLISYVLGLEAEQGYLSSILFMDQDQNFLEIRDVLNALNVTLPEEVYLNIGKTTLFLHVTENGNRIGFVAETTNELELIQTMKAWEEQAFQDTKPLFELFGFEQDPLVSYFLSTSKKKPAFRYQTFSKQDLGICYLITADYFIWTTSYETMEKVIENLGDLE